MGLSLVFIGVIGWAIWNSKRETAEMRLMDIESEDSTPVPSKVKVN